MVTPSATAIAFPNIAFIKYWGNRDSILRIPANDSISMNLEGLHSQTSVRFDPSLVGDRLILHGKEIQGPGLIRVSAVLERVRDLAGTRLFARVESKNNFPSGAGIASSASAFAALAVAAAAATGLELSEKDLSRLARLGSGSACRSVPGGFVEWQAGADDESSYAFSIAPPEHWGLVDCIAIVSQERKPTGSSEGHALADTSPVHPARLAGAQRRVEICRRAILERDFNALAELAEQDSTLMHAVMMTSKPPLFYWMPATLAVMHAVRAWRKEGVPVFYTVDAGPNVHVICPIESASRVSRDLNEIPGVKQVLIATPGGGARLITP